MQKTQIRSFEYNKEPFTDSDYKKFCFGIWRTVAQELQSMLTMNKMNIFYGMNDKRVVPWMMTGGQVFSRPYVYIYLTVIADVSAMGSKLFEAQLRSAVAHELHHAQRVTELGYIGAFGMLMRKIISEGLACNFEHMRQPDLYLPYVVANKEELKSIARKLPTKDIDNNESTNNLRFFSGGEGGIPHWAGYKLWYYLMGKVCDTLWKDAKELVGTSFEELEDVFMDEAHKLKQ